MRKERRTKRRGRERSSSQGRERARMEAFLVHAQSGEETSKMTRQSSQMAGGR